MLVKDALNQGFESWVRGHHAFDWKELGIQGVLGGVMGSASAQKATSVLKRIDKTGIAVSELQSLASGAASAAATNTHFDAGQILADNLGSAVGDAVLGAAMTVESSPLIREGEVIDISLLGKMYAPAEVESVPDAGSAVVKEKVASVSVPDFAQEQLFYEIMLGISEPGRNSYAASSISSEPNKRRLGNLAMEYETGMKPDNYLLAAGKISDGIHDAGGPSYGAYQLASIDPQHPGRDASVQSFLKNEGTVWANEFEGLDPKQPKGLFATKWKAIAERYAQKQNEAFFNAQHAYIYRENYTRCVDYLKEKTGLDINKQPLAVQEAVWSASVQHGNAKSFLEKAIRSVKLEHSPTDYAHALINAMYDQRITYVSNLHIPSGNNIIKHRYPLERQRALDMLKKF